MQHSVHGSSVIAQFGAELAQIRAECRAEMEAEIKRIRQIVADLGAAIVADLRVQQAERRAVHAQLARWRQQLNDAEAMEPDPPLQC